MKKQLSASAVIGSLAIFVALVRNSEYFSFLDKYVWHGYFLTQILFMGLLFSVIAILGQMVISGVISATEGIKAGRDLVAAVGDAQRADKKSTRTSHATSVQLAVNLNLGEKLPITAAQSIDYRELKSAKINAQILKSIVGLLFILVLIIILVDVDLLIAIFEYIATALDLVGGKE